MRAGLAMILALAACGGEREPVSVLDVTVRSAQDTVRFRVPARAFWCAADRSLELLGTRGDSGVGIALFPVDSLSPGAYPVVGPQEPLVPRPRGRVAARWFGKTLVEGYHSLSGVVTVDTGPGLSGRVTATLNGITFEGQQEIEGRFRNITVSAADGPCGVPADSPPPGPVP